MSQQLLMESLPHRQLCARCPRKYKKKKIRIFFLKHISDEFIIVVEMTRRGVHPSTPNNILVSVSKSWLPRQTAVSCGHKTMLLSKESVWDFRQQEYFLHILFPLSLHWDPKCSSTAAVSMQKTMLRE